MQSAGIRQLIEGHARVEAAFDDIGNDFLELHGLGKDEALDAAGVGERLGFAGDRGEKDHRDVTERKVVAEIHENTAAVPFGASSRRGGE